MDTPGQPVSRSPRCVEGRRPVSLPVASMAAAIAIALMLSSGCRSGASASAAPSWWSFGGKGGDAEKLAAAPPFDGAIKKPSEAATPYPTTTTPNGYAVADAGGGASEPVAPPALPAAEPAVVTYGSQPAPPAAVAAAPGPPAIGPQVGPYAQLASTPPPAVPAAAPPAPPSSAAAPSMPPYSAAPAAGSFPATAGYEPSLQARTADPYGLSGAPAAAPVEPASPASRYASMPGSRFGGVSFSSPGASAPLEPALVPPPAAAPAAATGLPLSPAVSPPPSAPAMLPAPPPLPGAPPLPSPQTTPPPRRPDPGYRPGGTSSYRPTRAILVESAPAAPSAVRTAAFETPVSPGQ